MTEVNDSGISIEVISKFIQITQYMLACNMRFFLVICTYAYIDARQCPPKVFAETEYTLTLQSQGHVASNMHRFFRKSILKSHKYYTNARH